MRLSLRLMVERGGRDDRLGFYLDDPIQLFVPARLMLGLIFSLATVVARDAHGIGQASRRSGCCCCSSPCSSCSSSTCCRSSSSGKNPQKALEILLPPFDFAARFFHPLTGTLVRLIVDSRRERESRGKRQRRG